MSVKKVPTVRRKFHFFDVVGDNFENILEEINKLEGDNIYSPAILGVKDINLSTRENVGDYYFGCFCSSKRTDFPQKVTRGKKTLTDIGFSKSEGLAESTHILYIPSVRILIVEYNHYGPRTTHIEHHINHIIGTGLLDIDADPISLQMRVNKDILSKLNHLETINMFSCKIKTDQIARVKELDQSLYDGLNAAQELGNTDTVEIIIRSSRKNRLSKANGLLNTLKLMIRKEPIGEIFKSLDLRGIDSSTNELTEVDLLEDKIEYVSDIIKTNSSRILDKSDLLQKLKSAYQSKKETLK